MPDESKTAGLDVRFAKPSDYSRLEKMVIDSFEPITIYRKVDERFGPLNGRDWRERWQARMRKVFDTQIILVGEIEGAIVAFASGTLDKDTKLALLDILAIDRGYQGRGFGRDMLRIFMDYMKEQGAQHLHLDCLHDNEKGNALYRSEGFEQMGGTLHYYIKLSEEG